MNFRVGACALLVCLAGCSAEAPDARLGAQTGKAATQLPGQKLRTVHLDRSASQSIANAPDRGKLIEYKNKGAAFKREGAYTWYPVAISEAHALKAVVTGEMTIPSPDGSQVKLKYERHEEQADGNWTWIGRVIGGDQKQEAIITFGEEAVYGSIPQSSGAPLSLQTRSGALYAVQTDLSKVKNPNTAATDMMVRPALALRSSLLSSATKAQVSQSATEKASSVSTTVDVAIGYTQGFATAQGGASAAVTRLTYLIAVGNQAFENSLITGALRLVNSVQVDYVDNTTNQTALEDLTGVRNDQAITVPTGLAPLRTAREQYGADLAVLVRKFQTPENDGCGIAWLNGAGQTAIDPALDDDYAFAVISDGNDTGTDTNTYFCAEETLVHEIGHLMGSAHDRDNSKTSAGALLYGRYAYSFGMKTASSAGNFYTIMAYGDSNQNFYRTFSNPLVLKCGPSANLACGVTDQTDNARSLNQTIPIVATFRAMVVPYVWNLKNDYNGDGKSDIFWRHSQTSQNSIWLAGVPTGARASTAAAGWNVVGNGDFNGDGTADLFWRHSTAAINSIWFSGYPTNPGSSSLAANWEVVGTGDFNGDGKDDVFWRDPTTGNNRIWWSGVATGATDSKASTGWKVVGTGDFNGDGNFDVLWRNPSTGDNSIWLSGVSTGAIGSKAAVGWQVAGTGDFNGDGKFDIFWRNKTTGLNSMWWSGTSTGATASQAATTWSVVVTGDFDGDGKWDLFWRSSINGSTAIWNSGLAANSKNGSTVSDQRWSVYPRAAPVQ